ncbi:DUF2933 domain-containing protein [Teichococcus aestuarii]|uniref:DUF2933 domain-containing protein n=1 Tax=Teichococcus aestuarii TaxID=568898 RepID=UPI0036201287
MILHVGRRSSMHDHAESSWWRSRTGIAVIGLGLIAAFYVLREHYAHVFGVKALPPGTRLGCLGRNPPFPPRPSRR